MSKYVYDNTGLDEWARGDQRLGDQFDAILYAMRERLGGVVMSAAQDSVTVADGEIKPEGMSGHSYLIDIPMTVERQLEAVRKGADASVAAIEEMPGETLLWREYPQVSRWIAEDGLHITVRMRIAKV